MVHGRRPDGWTLDQQPTGEDQGKTYDAMLIQRGGKSETAYLDITAFFGKLWSGYGAGLMRS